MKWILFGLMIIASVITVCGILGFGIWADTLDAHWRRPKS